MELTWWYSEDQEVPDGQKPPSVLKSACAFLLVVAGTDHEPEGGKRGSDDENQGRDKGANDEERDDDDD